MSKTVEFWFDFGSPAAYLAYTQLPGIAQRNGASIEWRPMLLGGVFQATDNRSPITVPAKGKYTFVDFKRHANKYGVPFKMALNFPVNTITLMRGATALHMQAASTGDRTAFDRYLKAVFEAMWHEPLDMTDLSVVGQVVTGAGLDAAALMAQIQSPEVKAQLKADTEAAVAKGIFGAPTFFIGDQMFWGQDRLDWVEAELQK